MRTLVFQWIPLVFLFQILSISWVSGQCLDDQRQLLLQLNRGLVYNATASKKLVNWNPNADCCKWAGVGCDGAGRVTSLQLENETISGGLNDSSLFSLVYLERLNLAFNRFGNAEIPKGIGNLSSLVTLNLSNAGFGGQIPIEVCTLRNLRSLNFSSRFPSFNPLKLENPNLKTLVENFTALRELNLDSVNISASASDWLQALSSSLPDLRILSLRQCGLSGPLDSLSQLRSISVLNLDRNNLSSEVPFFRQGLSNLSSLSLSSCFLQGTFPETIFQIPNLQNLDLSNNVLLNGNIPQFPQRGSLRTLVLSFTNFSGSLPDSISNLGMLSKIDLSNCKFSGPIPPTITNLTELVHLDFSFNSFTGSIPLFHMSKKLSYLDLSRNQLTGSPSSEHFEGLSSLEFINLGSNLLTGSITSSLFGLPSLQTLLLSNNQFTDQIRELPIANSYNLDTLDLSSNRLAGSIPKWFFNLGKLKSLSLSFNFFNGTMHLDMIKNFPYLTRLDLAYNNLAVDVEITNSNSSQFPQLTRLNLASCKVNNFPDLSGQYKLNFLDLSNNLIGGEIPNWIWRDGISGLNYLNLSNNHLVGLEAPYQVSSSLIILDLHSNQLSGKLPTPPLSAMYVDYSSNNFSEHIPLNTSKFISFLFFSVANNSLTGAIPTWPCNALYLRVLDLSVNLLNDSIPPCLLRNNGSLGVLNLGRNNFSGDIPNVFPVNCSLKTLDLSGNNLAGKIPASLANCESLEVLNVGNNIFEDTFPCMLNTITSLRVLVLRSNKLYGNVSCPEADQQTESNLQIIDVASNNFDGNLSSKYILGWIRMKQQNVGDTHLNFSFLKLNNLYYQDTVTVTIKGLELELVKILTVFTSIDFSSNYFHGEIPDAIGELKSLYALNLSHNSLTGTIPKSFGNLSQLGSLDLSRNQLTGEIPKELTSLNFLSFLNLSYNMLVGMIPRGTQFQTFTEEMFEGNTGLCGFPLNRSCDYSFTQSSTNTTRSSSETEFDWQFILTGLGYGVGAAIIAAPLTFCKEWRVQGNKQVEQVLKLIFPNYRFSYVRYDGKVEAIPNLDDESTDDDSDDEEDRPSSTGRYCVFCTKINIEMKNVMHNQSCTCHYTPPMFSSSPTSSSSSILVGYRKIP